jgi:hypothetical protein
VAQAERKTRKCLSSLTLSFLQSESIEGADDTWPHINNKIYNSVCGSSIHNVVREPHAAVARH